MVSEQTIRMRNWRSRAKNYLMHIQRLCLANHELEERVRCLKFLRVENEMLQAQLASVQKENLLLAQFLMKQGFPKLSKEEIEALLGKPCPQTEST